MTGDANRFLELLEQRIVLLQTLSGALSAARAAVVSCDITGFEAHITQQETLCREIAGLDAQLGTLRQKCRAEVSLRGVEENREWSEKLRNTLERSQVAEEALKGENESHQAVVRRSKRTVTALLNSFQTFEGNYENLVYLSFTRMGELGGEV